MTAASSDTLTTLDEIVDNFSLLEEWDDRYRYVIELGRGLRPLPERDRTEANKVQGCASQVWLATTVHANGQGGPTLTFSGDSDAHRCAGSSPSCSQCFPESGPATFYRPTRSQCSSGWACASI
jgi:sulfur transfer protein SufE